MPWWRSQNKNIAPKTAFISTKPFSQNISQPTPNLFTSPTYNPVIGNAKLLPIVALCIATRILPTTPPKARLTQISALAFPVEDQ
jgi:hypothetical protein